MSLIEPDCHICSRCGAKTSLPPPTKVASEQLGRGGTNCPNCGELFESKDWRPSKWGSAVESFQLPRYHQQPDERAERDQQ